MPPTDFAQAGLMLEVLTYKRGRLLSTGIKGKTTVLTLLSDEGEKFEVVMPDSHAPDHAFIAPDRSDEVTHRYAQHIDNFYKEHKLDPPRLSLPQRIEGLVSRFLRGSA